MRGLGSFVFYGRRSDVAQLLHDVPLVGTLGFVAGWASDCTATSAGCRPAGRQIVGTSVWRPNSSDNAPMISPSVA